ncbi:MAG: BlaI/MecI/CopY family transcriptional regulator [bacterium]|nr:BlaI/MecI/CopY family transcriptional regulator [bacterium]
MPRRKSPTLTEAELRLMEVLWEHGPATVNDVVRRMAKRRRLAYSSVLTTMRILEQKGYVTHAKRGRAFVYEPLIGRSEAQTSAVRYVLSRFFENSPEALVLNVLENEQLDARELKKLRRMVQEEES